MSSVTRPLWAPGALSTSLGQGLEALFGSPWHWPAPGQPFRGLGQPPYLAAHLSKPLAVPAKPFEGFGGIRRPPYATEISHALDSRPVGEKS